MSKVIGVDVDLTVADSDDSHWDWLGKVGVQHTFPNKTQEVDYNLGNYFHLPDKVDSRDYWRLSDIYDEKPEYLRPVSGLSSGVFIRWIPIRPVQPIKGSQRVLKDLKSEGWEILFISHIKGNHHKSKVEWLKRHFPFMDGFIATKEKHYANACCDIFIDDRNIHLNKSKAPFNIKFETPYLQDEPLEEGSVDLITRNWVQIGEWIKSKPK